MRCTTCDSVLPQWESNSIKTPGRYKYGECRNGCREDLKIELNPHPEPETDQPE